LTSVRLKTDATVVRIGIDLGGTKIEGIALDGDLVLARRRVESPRNDYDRTVRAIVELVHLLKDETGADGSVGIGIPGALSTQTGLVKNANSVWIIGHPLHRDLREPSGSRSA